MPNQETLGLQELNDSCYRRNILEYRSRHGCQRNVRVVTQRIEDEPLIDGYVETVASEVLLRELAVGLDRLFKRVEETVRNLFQVSGQSLIYQ